MASKLCRNVWSKCNLLRRATTFSGYRTLLSAAYACDEAWLKRLESPLLQKVEPAGFAMKIFEKFERDKAASAVDMDILANKADVLEMMQLDFTQNLFRRFRLTEEARKTLDSTSYAFLRALLALGEYERLLQILEDKISYGLFLNDHLANLLLDCFVENKMYHEAARVAFDQMLQEDFDHPITWLYSWYACQLHWENPPAPVVAEEVEEDAVADDEDEELDWIRVRFLQYPFYDDHFDIPEESQKLGKTFWMVGKRSPDLLGRSYQLIGLGLYEKFDRGLLLLRQVLDDGDIKDGVTKEAVDSFQSTLDEIETKEPPTEEKEVGMMTMEDVYPIITAEMKEQFQEELQDLLRQLKDAGKIVSGYDVKGELLERLRAAVAENEEKDALKQTAMFQEWTVERQRVLDEQVEKLRKQQKKEELAKRLVDLQEKEEQLQYFEELDKIRIGMAHRKKERPIKDVTQEEVYVLPPGERGKGVL